MEFDAIWSLKQPWVFLTSYGACCRRNAAEGSSQYLNSVLVSGNSFEEELARLMEIFVCLGKTGLKLSPKKCTLFKSEISFLGHVIDREGVRIDLLMVGLVERWPVPWNI